MSAPLEHDEQVALIRWRDQNVGRIPSLAWLHAIPNGGYRDKRTALKLKAEGVTPGVADLSWPRRRDPYSGLYLELKRRTGDLGDLRRSQRAFKNHVESEGFYFAVAFGWRHAVEIITAYEEQRWDDLDKIIQ